MYEITFLSDVMEEATFFFAQILHSILYSSTDLQDIHFYTFDF